MKNLYTVKPGESPADVAQKYTGRRDRYRDLLVLNKHLRQTTDGMTGRAVFDKRDWIPGMGITIPRYWADKGPMYSVHKSAGQPPTITANMQEEPIELARLPESDTRYTLRCPPNMTYNGYTQRCEPKRWRKALQEKEFVQQIGSPGDVPEVTYPNDPEISGEAGTSQSIGSGKCTPPGAEITEYKNYYYEVTQDDIGNFWKIPAKFNYPTMIGTTYSWTELRNANLDWVGGFKNDGHGACQLSGLYAGALLRVPKHWPEPKSSVKTVPITEAKDKCPAGQVFAGGKCVDQGGPEDPWEKKDGLETVGADSGDSNTIWMLLAAGAAVAGGIFLYNSKKKTTR